MTHIFLGIVVGDYPNSVNVGYYSWFLSPWEGPLVTIGWWFNHHQPEHLARVATSEAQTEEQSGASDPRGDFHGAAKKRVDVLGGYDLELSRWNLGTID